MRSFICFVLLVLAVSCSSDLENQDITLEDGLKGRTTVLDNVIACAASNQNDDLVSVFFYPRTGATNIRYYETEDLNVSKNDFDEYYRLEIPSFNVFNGYLKKFEVAVSEEKWVIVTFQEGGETHVSNPIRLKHFTKPTQYASQNIKIDSIETGMPIFSWEDGEYTDSEIYFQVVSDASDNLLSGTYTYENSFQYYNLDNVVLNITTENPLTLKSESTYNFTLMAVSEDNWVNLISEKEF
ncbi:hypothetical protein [Zobellia uliginosa]|uniref:hypothetical protein n=1 Tax=Zobellia uliginosa TaxID=143224 RepID=UPI001C073847|nr:hypothetical protein [Zobellia uliginosa]MBU2948730.1 hypothetical protein [Zobellia uliginosa]